MQERCAMSRTTADQRQAEVIVVGAGPAGSTAAFHLAQAGVDVLLLEKTAFPREKVCGDGLTPRAGQQLPALGPADGAGRVVGVTAKPVDDRGRKTGDEITFRAPVVIAADGVSARLA